jgi:uncharacterized membrane protein
MKRTIIIFVIVILLSSFVSAITLKDINTNQPISNITIYYTLGEEVFSKFIEDDLPLKKDTKIEIRGYYPETPSIDYYADTKITKETQNIFLTPVGALRGVVKDKLNNVINNAELKFECTFETEFPKNTDSFGTFNIENIPVGNCKILAKHKKLTGHQNIEIQQGSINEIEISLNKEIKSSAEILLPLLIILIIVIIVGSITYTLIKKIKKKESKPQKKNKRINDILKTLNTKEKEIVNLLLENHNELSQAIIRHNTGIPRTTLSRVLEALESKNIIEIERMGKLVKIKLSAWFLGKEV